MEVLFRLVSVSISLLVIRITQMLIQGYTNVLQRLTTIKLQHNRKEQLVYINALYNGELQI